MKTLREKLESYNLPFISIVTIEECVTAMSKYDKLPLATKESIQVIADMYDVFFTFAQKRSKMLLSGIGTPYLRATYLFPDGKLGESQRLLKNTKDWFLFPNADHKIKLAV